MKGNDSEKVKVDNRLQKWLLRPVLVVLQYSLDQPNQTIVLESEGCILSLEVLENVDSHVNQGLRPRAGRGISVCWLAENK